MFTIRSYAKINWFLRILGRRGDGFHDLETLFQTIDLHDDIVFEPASRDSLRCDDPSIPTDGSNLVLRALAMLRETRDVPPLAIRIRKRIPSGGGLGGGSSNAAATLRAADAIFNLGVRDDELNRIAGSLGSDIPFFLVGGTAYATGRGEILAPLDAVGPAPLLLLLPKDKVATPAAYRALADRRQRLRVAGSVPRGVDAIRFAVAGGIRALCGEITNDLESPVFDMVPSLRRWKLRLVEEGAIASLMSGSGSTLFGVFEDPALRDRAAERLAAEITVVRAEPIERKHL
ncbi:MAG: 4-(cytidine 5'-diphospho)-2-C-methyl-D-erythritol kinase [Thermoanaerobaculia bacterium]